MVKPAPTPPDPRCERLCAILLRAAKAARRSGAVYLRGPAAKDGAGLVLVEATPEEQRCAA